MGKSSGGGTQTVKQNTVTEPWSAAQPYMLQAIQSAQSLFNQGPPAYYPGNTVAPFSDQTLAGMNDIQANASQAAPLANAGIDKILALINGGAPAAGTANVNGIASGDQSNPFLASLASAGNTPVDTSYLTPFATGSVTDPLRGQFTATAATPINGVGTTKLQDIATSGATNPYLDQMFGAASSQVKNAVNDAFQSSGRAVGGSTNYADVLSRNLGDLASNIYGTAYGQDQANRLSAAGALAGQENQGVDRQLNALTSEAGLSEADLGRQFTAGNNLAGFSASDLSRALQAAGLGTDASLSAFGAGAGQQNAQNAQALTGAGMLPDMYQFGNQGGTDLITLGQMLENQNQNQINSDVNAYNYNATAPQALIDWYNGVVSGQGAQGGTSSGTSQQPVQRSNPFLTAAGDVTAVASIAKAIPDIISMFSDRRLKTNIKHVATDATGLKWYDFEYLDRPGEVQFGVMADEAPPHAVSIHESGYAMVDYGALHEGRVH